MYITYIYIYIIYMYRGALAEMGGSEARAGPRLSAESCAGWPGERPYNRLIYNIIQCNILYHTTYYNII